MSHELWATYSVKDHCTPRALAADIMLFDRLVFPVPQTPRIEGHEHEEAEAAQARSAQPSTSP